MSATHPCPVCGKPDWCSVSSEGVWACCRRESSGGTRRSDKSGMEYYLHCLKPGHGSLPKRRYSQSSAVREPVRPQLDPDRYFRLFSYALENLLCGSADSWLKKRRISRQWVERCPNLAFVEHAAIAGWKYPIINSWIIRVPSANGKCHGLKLHRENPPKSAHKSAWLPFGTIPQGRPRHCFSTLWPPPEWFPADATILIVEGELKAARACSAGYCATSPTTGAQFSWQSEEVRRLAGRSVVIIYDQDQAGERFRNKTLAALNGQVMSLRTVTPKPSPGVCE